MQPIEPTSSRSAKNLVLWDGECGFCRRSVGFLAQHDRYGTLRFQPNQEADISPELRAACQNSVHVIKSDGEILRGGRAVMFCGEQTKWHRLARIAQWPIFLPFVELGYAIVAKNRLVFSKWLFTREGAAPDN